MEADLKTRQAAKFDDKWRNRKASSLVAEIDTRGSSMIAKLIHPGGGGWFVSSTCSGNALLYYERITDVDGRVLAERVYDCVIRRSWDVLESRD